MQLNELFNRTDFAFDVSSTAEGFSASTQLKNGKTLSILCAEDSAYSWDIEFSVDGGYSLTNDGNEYEVMSAVIYALTLFVKDKNPTSITMAAEGSNRRDLYIRMMKRVVPSWKIVFVPRKHEPDSWAISAAKDKFYVDSESMCIRALANPGLTFKLSSVENQTIIEPTFGLKRYPEVYQLLKPEVIELYNVAVDELSERGRKIEIRDELLFNFVVENKLKYDVGPE